MKIFKDNFKLELFNRQLFVKGSKKAKYEVIIIRTYNDIWKYKIKVLLNSKPIKGGTYSSNVADSKWDAKVKARKIIKDYETSLKKDEIAHRLYI